MEHHVHCGLRFQLFGLFNKIVEDRNCQQSSRRFASKSTDCGPNLLTRARRFFRDDFQRWRPSSKTFLDSRLSFLKGTNTRTSVCLHFLKQKRNQVIFSYMSIRMEFRQFLCRNYYLHAAAIWGPSTQSILRGPEARFLLFFISAYLLLLRMRWTF